MRVAILDDYQNVALSMADWSEVAARADITVFNDHLADQDAVVERLAPFDVVCVMRERTPLPRNVIERLPRLKMIASTGPFNASIDVAAAKERGIYVSTTGGYVESTVELTWALILAAARRIVDETAVGAWRRLADLRRPPTGRHSAGRARTGADRQPGSAGRQGVRHGRHRVEHEPDPRGRRTSRGDLRVQGRVVQPRRRSDHPSGAQRALPRPGRRRRVGTDEADGVASQHISRPDCRRVGSRRRSAVAADSPAPASTSSTPSRCRPGTRCDRWTPWSPRRTSVTSPSSVYRVFYGEAATKIAAWLSQVGSG